MKRKYARIQFFILYSLDNSSKCTHHNREQSVGHRHLLVSSVALVVVTCVEITPFCSLSGTDKGWHHLHGIITTQQSPLYIGPDIGIFPEQRDYMRPSSFCVFDISGGDICRRYCRSKPNWGKVINWVGWFRRAGYITVNIAIIKLLEIPIFKNTSKNELKRSE